MEIFQQHLLEAKKAFETADHLAFVTFPLINDAKLLLLITQNVQKALNNAMDALLSYDELYKRIPPLPSDFITRYEIFRSRIAKRYNIPRENIVLINDINSILIHRRESPIEFARKDKFIIASETYKLKMLTLNKVRNYVLETKKFIDKVNEVLRHSDRRIN